jgi:REP element-mobilizing transposase RayT
MDRFWFLTSTFYGNWLPGDPRGFVSRLRDRRPGELAPLSRSRRTHNQPGTPFDTDIPGLARCARDNLESSPVRLDTDQAVCLRDQMIQTAAFRDWQLLAIAVMSNHVHLVVGVPGDPDPARVLGDFKAYGSRALTKRWGKPPGGRWWTHGGSTRKLPDASAMFAAIAYIRDQPYPLEIWVNPDFVED